MFKSVYLRADKCKSWSVESGEVNVLNLYFFKKFENLALLELIYVARMLQDLLLVFFLAFICILNCV